MHTMRARREGEDAAERRGELAERMEDERARLSEADGVKKLEGKVRSEAKKIEDARGAMDEAEASLPTLEGRIEERAERKKEEDGRLEAIFEETKGITERLRVELEERTQELAPLQQERSVFQNSLDTAQMEVNLLEDAASRASEQLKCSEKEMSSLDDKQKKKRAELKECDGDLATGKERVGDAERELRELTEKEATLTKKNTELLTQVEAAQASVQSTAGCSRVANAILKASKKGGQLAPCVVMGRLGDLATIGSKYDVAVSTACGMLNHIVVQTAGHCHQEMKAKSGACGSV